MQTRSSVLTKGPPTIRIESQRSEFKSHVSPGVTMLISGFKFRFTEQSMPPNPSLHMHTPAKQISFVCKTLFMLMQISIVFVSLLSKKRLWFVLPISHSMRTPWCGDKASEKQNWSLSLFYHAKCPPSYYPAQPMQKTWRSITKSPYTQPPLKLGCRCLNGRLHSIMPVFMNKQDNKWAGSISSGLFEFQQWLWNNNTHQINYYGKEVWK